MSSKHKAAFDRPCVEPMQSRIQPAACAAMRLSIKGHDLAAYVFTDPVSGTGQKLGKMLGPYCLKYPADVSRLGTPTMQATFLSYVLWAYAKDSVAYKLLPPVKKVHNAINERVGSRWTCVRSTLGSGISSNLEKKL